VGVAIDRLVDRRVEAAGRAHSNRIGTLRRLYKWPIVPTERQSIG